ncbi:MAGE family-domain-containing protein [Cyathus striatus]|nr:MAGE family-domain-containing protein [Cyathus striatus]
MVRATTRSQRATQAPRPSQSQPARSQHRASGSRRAIIEEEDDEEDNEDNNEEQDDDEEEPRGTQMDLDDEGDLEITRKANELVRLALFVEQKRMTLRREEINKKVLGQSTRSFNRVFTVAQHILRETFGMELAELPSRAGLEHDAHDEELNEARRAAGMKSKAANLLSKTYILRSCLHPELIERAAQTNEKILEEEIVDDLSEDEHQADNSEDEDRPPKSYGSIISWSKGDQLGTLGILYVILSLILVNGRVVSDMDLRSHLKRLRLPSTPGRSPVHFTTTATHRSMSTDDYLSVLLRQGYLDRQIIGDKSKAKGAKRVRSAQEDDAARLYEWRWGPRAMCEVGEAGIGHFVAEFMAGDMEGYDEDESAQVRKNREEKLEKMMKGVERAAGGKLIDLR